MDRDGDWQLVVHEEQEGLPRDAGTQAMVPFTGEGQAPFAGPLAIRVGRKAAGFVYARQDPAELLWKYVEVRTRQRPRPAAGGQLGLVPRVVSR